MIVLYPGAKHNHEGGGNSPECDGSTCPAYRCMDECGCSAAPAVLAKIKKRTCDHNKALKLKGACDYCFGYAWFEWKHWRDSAVSSWTERDRTVKKQQKRIEKLEAKLKTLQEER